MQIERHPNNEMKINKRSIEKKPGENDDINELEETQEKLNNNKELDSIEIKEDYVEFLDESNDQLGKNNKNTLNLRTNLKNINEGKVLIIFRYK